MKKILIIIPTYNEADNIKPLMSAIAAAFRGRPAWQPEVLFVDDDSPDGTADIIRDLQAHDKRIHLLSGTKQGLGRAYVRGMTHGLGLKAYFAVVMMDADLSHDPGDIPALLAKLDEGADYIIGSRYVTGGRTVRGYPVRRRLQSALANAIARQFIDLKTDVKDLTSGFKAIRSSSLETIPLDDIIASGYVFQVSLLYEFAKRNRVIREVPITFHFRRSGQSKLGLYDVTEFLRLTYLLNPYSRLRRMIRFGSVGAIGAVVNLLVLVTLVRVARLDVMVAYLLALETSIVCNFFLNNWFTFRTRRDETADRLSPYVKLGKLLRYNLVGLGGAAIAWLVFSAAFRELRLSYVLADVLGIVAATSWNYWLSVRIVWHIVDTPPPERTELRHEFQET